MALQHLRSSTANKRPDPTAMAAGQLAINSEATSPGLFFKDSAGNLVKVGPVHVGTTAPNATPAGGGTAGNSKGELWLDTSLTPNELKTWDGSAWVSATGQEIPVSKLADGAARQLLQTDAAGTGVEWTSNVDVPGTLDVTSTATFDSIISASAGTASAPSITFTGDVNTGIYSPGADTLAISTNGAQRVTVDSTGRVGIGIASPINIFDVVGASQISHRYTGASQAFAFGQFDSSGNASVNNIANASLLLATNNTERARIDSSGRFLVGTSSARSNFFNSTVGLQAQIEGITYQAASLSLTATADNYFDCGTIVLAKGRGGAVGSNTIVQNGSPPDILGYLSFQGNDGTEFVEGASIKAEVDGGVGANDLPTRLVLSVTSDTVSSPTERMRISSNGAVSIQTTVSTAVPNGPLTAEGIQLGGGQSGFSSCTANNAKLFDLNRLGSDGLLMSFWQDNVGEGTISVSGTSVFFNGAHLCRWSQIEGIDPHDKTIRPEILRGTVMSNLDEMCSWADPASGETQDNEQLNKTKVSDVEGDKNVSGVFDSWDDEDDVWVNDYFLAMTGDFIIRIAAGTTVERGDLLMSAGDGTAKPQDDDIIRSKTIAKVTSTNVSCTHPDGSYCVPCVLMAC